MHFEILALASSFLEFHNLSLVIGWILAILLGAFALAIIYKMWKGDIDLKYLIAGDDGDASLSRFQFLIFTFVIAMSLFLIIVNKTGGPGFPNDIPGSILALLGISGGSYVASKGVDANTPPKTTITTVTPNPPPIPPTTTTLVSEPKSGE
jgi:FtsH-binding integral membrane protein